MNANWLAQLAPEHPPAPPSWWPPAPGWWLCAALALVLGAALVVWGRYSQRARWRRVRRAALGELQRIRSHEDDGAAARAIQRLLRRYALTVFGPDRVAKLTGESWLQFIAQHGGAGLAGEHGQWLLRAAFGQSDAPAPRESWFVAAQGFIRNAPYPRRRAEPAP